MGRVFAEDVTSTHSLASFLRAELWEEASAAHGHLGDAPPMISEAEAFVRHNTHDCLAPHHEKDDRVLQLFAPKFMAGRALAILRVSSKGHLEVDLLRGSGAVTRWGLVVIHRGHMQALPLPSSRVQELVEHFSSLGRVVRDLEVCGWAAYLEQGEGYGTMMLSKQHPAVQVRQSLEILPMSQNSLRDRGSFSHGPVGRRSSRGGAVGQRVCGTKASSVQSPWSCILIL